MRRGNEELGRFSLPILLFSLVVYANVASNLQVFQDNISVYILKHVIVVITSLFGLKLINQIRPSALIFFIFLSVCYFYAGLYFYALMVIHLRYAIYLHEFVQ